MGAWVLINGTWYEFHPTERIRKPSLEARKLLLPCQ